MFFLNTNEYFFLLGDALGGTVMRALYRSPGSGKLSVTGINRLLKCIQKLSQAGKLQSEREASMGESAGVLLRIAYKCTCIP